MERAKDMLQTLSERGCIWIVELAPSGGRKVAVTWTGDAGTQAEAEGLAIASAEVALRATAWRKGADGPSGDFALRVLIAEMDGEEWRETISIEPSALKIPGVKRAGRHPPRKVSQEMVGSLAADVATCVVASFGPEAPDGRAVEIGQVESPAQVEDRRRRRSGATSPARRARAT